MSIDIVSITELDDPFNGDTVVSFIVPVRVDALRSWRTGPVALATAIVGPTACGKLPCGPVAIAAGRLFSHER